VPALPWVSAFPELNVRTYVRVDGRPGVYFFSLDAASALAVMAARTLLGLPYYTADMEVRAEKGWVVYRSRRTETSDRHEREQRRDTRAHSRSGTSPGVTAEWVARYRADGEVFEPSPGTLEYFLTERYCLYTVSGARIRRLDIHHPLWRLQRAEAIVERNTMAEACGIRLPSMAPLLHFAQRQDMVAYAPYEVT
jgi:uncharacterized protein YqjF (DUF2071 family)